METRIHMTILPQPDDNTCGPTCLQAVYGYYGDDMELARVISEVKTLEGGGTLAVLLGCHALARGYRAKLYSYDVQVLDPSWFEAPGADLKEKLLRQMEVKKEPRLQAASRAYLDYLALGGEILFQDLTTELLRGILKQQTPAITGLCATYLYKTRREIEKDGALFYDDISGLPTGHFTVLCGYDTATRTVLLADPLMPNPISKEPLYSVRLNRLLAAVMLGVLTSDANILVITPAK